MKRVVAQGRWREGPKDWIEEQVFSQPPRQVRPSAKVALLSLDLVSAAQRGSQQDAWQELWVELQLGDVS